MRSSYSTLHIHIADSKGNNEEGLQINEGEIDFNFLSKTLNSLPKASFIPEVWQGHENNGEGFWKALERLENSLNPTDLLRLAIIPARGGSKITSQEFVILGGKPLVSHTINAVINSDSLRKLYFHRMMMKCSIMLQSISNLFQWPRCPPSR